MDSISHVLAVATFVLVTLQFGFTMLRELSDIFTKRRLNKLRQMFDKSGPSFPLSFSDLVERTRYKEDSLRSALYDLRSRGEIDLAANNTWVKISTARRR